VKIRRSFNVTLTGDDILGAPYSPTSVISGINIYELDDLVNFTDFTNLFEYYRITGVKLRWHLRRAPETDVLASAATYPQLYTSKTKSSYASDLLAGTGAAAVSNMLESSNLQMRVLEPNKPVTMFLRPAVAQDAFTGTVIASGAVGNPWLPTADGGTTNYYGLKFIIDELRSPQQFVDVTATYYVQFKGYH